MTHEELLKGLSTRGLVVEPCEGTVTLMDAVKDEIWDVVERRHSSRLISLFHCDRCRKALSIDLDSNKLLNQYPADPKTMFRALAEAFAIPSNGVPVESDDPISRTN